MIGPAAIAALLVSLKVAAVATGVALVPGIALGRLLARRNFPAKAVVETIVMLPMVLPPTAVGYLLLRLLARSGPLGQRTLGFDLDLLLTWKAAALAALVMAFPLIARTARTAFEEVDPRLEAMARTLGLGPLRVFIEVTLPLARRGLFAAAIMGFSRAIGEFGATIIVAGNIPGRTQTLALAIFEDIQAGRDEDAMPLLVLTVLIAFAAIYTVELLQRRGQRTREKAS